MLHAVPLLALAVLYGLVSILLGISLWMRLKLSESPAFTKLVEEDRGGRVPQVDDVAGSPVREGAGVAHRAAAGGSFASAVRGLPRHAGRDPAAHAGPGVVDDVDGPEHRHGARVGHVDHLQPRACRRVDRKSVV